MGDFRVTLGGERGEMSAMCGAVVLVGVEPDRRVPGIFHVSAGAPRVALEATAAKVSALLGRSVIRRDGSSASVREALCRACGTCAEVCPFGAVEIRNAGRRLAASVIAGRCQGCGLCVARCPSGAMAQGAYSDRDIALSLELLCRGWK
jgi:ferredoxin